MLNCFDNIQNRVNEFMKLKKDVLMKYDESNVEFTLVRNQVQSKFKAFIEWYNKEKEEKEKWDENVTLLVNKLAKILINGRKTQQETENKTREIKMLLIQKQQLIRDIDVYQTVNCEEYIELKQKSDELTKRLKERQNKYEEAQKEYTDLMKEMNELNKTLEELNKKEEIEIPTKRRTTRRRKMN
ncbi:hypothetical protein QTN25_008305 [Entamoeba marina]